MKKIFTFIGSRNDDGHTVTFAKKLIKAINKQDETWECELATLNSYNVLPANLPSYVDDDLEELKNKIINADLIVLGAPVYMHGIPGEMKNIIDRLADWAHTLRLVGKDIVILSTCNSNGHMTVANQLHLYAIQLGGRVVGKYVATNFMPTETVDTENIILNDQIDEFIEKIAFEVLEKQSLPWKTNRLLETTFITYQQIQKNNVLQNIQNEENKYWVDSGMLDCGSLQEYYNFSNTR
ncbi:MAG: NAD(P)H-dependent oxidoreductase [Lactobacillaceae bacterium]|jgi:multimeric flavodoxin WrbA|nr:NAD(P)H-dependent oxidoreductase [Lactobacillaceae bacterium]